MRAVSEKRENENRERRKMLAGKYGADWRNGTVPCERCFNESGAEPHELKKRSHGGSITDPHNVRLLCHTCHRWTEEEVAEATEAGWIIPSWKAVQPPVQERSILDDAATRISKP